MKLLAGLQVVSMLSSPCLDPIRNETTWLAML